MNDAFDASIARLREWMDDIEAWLDEADQADAKRYFDRDNRAGWERAVNRAYFNLKAAQ